MNLKVLFTSELENKLYGLSLLDTTHKKCLEIRDTIEYFKGLLVI